MVKLVKLIAWETRIKILVNLQFDLSDKVSLPYYMLSPVSVIFIEVVCLYVHLSAPVGTKYGGFLLHVHGIVRLDVSHVAKWATADI